jgi:hypothetical protein
VKPLVTTIRALKELATGLSPDAVATSTVLFSHTSEECDYLLHKSDELTEQRVVVMRDANRKEVYVPDHLAEFRREAISRMASFVERTQLPGPVSLPRGWHQYKYHNLIAFFAVHGSDPLASRWIAEVLSGERPDVVFWTTTTSSSKLTLEEFDGLDRRPPPLHDRAWAAAVTAADEHFAEVDRAAVPDVEISLAALDQSATKGWSYDQWMGAVSADQRLFIEAPTDRSIRLRGPAGSGKTLAITLKAAREVLEARKAGDTVRVLVVTHSWALATEIQDSLDRLGLGPLREVDVFPLLEIAQNISPHYVQDASGYSLVGDDSFSGKQAQLDEIFDILDLFIRGDWITFKSKVSESLRKRFDSEDIEERMALAWDLLVEFGSVIGAAAIFPGAGAEARYAQLPRASWMLPLHSREDLRVVFELYSRYMENLEARSLLTSDQVLADLLSHLETHAWNRARRTQGYDLVFVDEFHLFSPLERQVLHYLSRDVSVYPRVFMAVDPRQSPSEAFIGLAADDVRSQSFMADASELTDVASYDLTTVHRFTPQILSLIKHVHHEFPTLDLGRAWDVDFENVASVQDDGPIPQLVLSASRAGEESDIAKSVYDLYSGGRLALAVVDTRQWRRFSELAGLIGQSGKYHVTTISSRSDISGLGYRKRGLVVGPAEYLAGLQFDAVLVAGVPDLQAAVPTANERTRFLSLLYLALSRAEREVRIFVNEDDGGLPEVLQRGISNGVISRLRGSLV